MNAPNEGREENRKTAIQFLRDSASVPSPQIAGVLMAMKEYVEQELKLCDDQLSKERETNSNSYWRSQFSFLQKDYDEKSKQLEKEREIRKENLKQAFQAGRAYEARRIDGLPNFDEWYESLI